MENSKKIALLEEMMELDEGSLIESTLLSDVEEWDSLAALSLIVLLEDNFGKKITGVQIKKFETVNDILVFMD